jgi:DNA mismatch repair protein MutS2
LGEPPDDERMVPMDVLVPEGVRAVVITGPNTGGKTVMLKTLGLAALMARAGLRVLCAPDAAAASAARVPFFPAVLADIGDDQSIVQSLSTFSAHVARIRRILAHAVRRRPSPHTRRTLTAHSPHTRRTLTAAKAAHAAAHRTASRTATRCAAFQRALAPSIQERVGASGGGALVLLDEVGSGTDPTEGSALGMAVLRALADDAALTLATTHHGRLKSLKYAPDDAGVFENACVEFE